MVVGVGDIKTFLSSFLNNTVRFHFFPIVSVFHFHHVGLW